MENAISTKLEYPTYKGLIDNFKKEKYWRKKWLVFRSAQCTITIMLGAILTSEQEVVFTADDNFSDFGHNLYISIDGRITEKMFVGKLQRFIFECIEHEEERSISLSDEYTKASDDDDVEFYEKLVEYYNMKEGTEFKGYQGTNQLYESEKYDIITSYEDMMVAKGFYTPRMREKRVMRSHKFNDFSDSYKLLLSQIKDDGVRKDIEAEMDK